MRKMRLEVEDFFLDVRSASDSVDSSEMVLCGDGRVERGDSGVEGNSFKSEILYASVNGWLWWA